MLVFCLLLLSACNFGGDGEDTTTSTSQTTASSTSCEVHEWDLGYLTSSPTCSHEGEFTYHCFHCDATRTESIPRLPHTFSDEWTTDTTHHWHRATCDCHDEVSDKAEHTWDAGELTESPTCATYGKFTYTCTTCAEIKIEYIPSLPHTYSDEWTVGTVQHWRKNSCGCAWVDAIDYGDHIWDEGVVTTEPTCATYGIRTYTCAICKGTKTEYIDYLPHTYSDEWTGNTSYHWREANCGCNTPPADRAAHTWDEGKVTTDPTCAAKGVRTYTCTVCKGTKTSNIAMLTSHTWSADVIVTAPTCTAKGYTTHSCIYCDASYTDNETDMLSHGYHAVVTAPTCTAKGYTTHTCSGCGDSYTDSYTDILSHAYESVVTDPTCTAAGFTTHTCSVCGDSYQDTPTDMLPHPYESVVTAPTCTKIGYTTHTCTVCGDTYRGDEVSPLPHTDVMTTIAPTCTEYGYTVKTCQVCGNVRKVATEYPLGHAFANGICTRCGEKEYSIGLSYTLSDDETYYIIDGMGSCEDTELILPHTHAGLPVREIAASAFAGKTTITSVTFLAGGIPKTFRADAFAGCSNLTAVYISDLALWCENYFYGAAANPLFVAHHLYVDGTLVTALTLPETVTKLPAYAFAGCTDLTKVTVPTSVYSMGVSAFADCTAIQSITLPFSGASNSATEENFHFGYIFGAASYTDHSSDVPTSLTNVTITNQYTIQSNAFANCSALTHITISKSISYINDAAFAGCTGVKEIRLPFVGSFLGRIFGATTYQENSSFVPVSLKYVTITGGTIDAYAFYGCESIKKIELIEDVTSIGTLAFSGCNSLTILSLGPQISSISEQAFSYCGNLTYIDVSLGNTTYHSDGDCLIETETKTLLTGGITCVIPDDGSVESIASYAFEGRTGLVEIELPSDITLIGAYAFRDCTSFTSLKCTYYGGWYRSSNTYHVENRIPLDKTVSISSGDLTHFWWVSSYWYKVTA